MTTAAYNKPPFLCDFIGGIGLQVQGNVVLAGGGDLGTRSLTLQDRKILVTVADDRLCFDPSRVKPYEVIVSDWQPQVIIVDLTSAAREHANYGIPLDIIIEEIEAVNLPRVLV